jgi:hypothetical protein
MARSSSARGPPPPTVESSGGEREKRERSVGPKKTHETVHCEGDLFHILFHGLGNWEVKSYVETGLIQKLPYEVFIHSKNDLPFSLFI